MMRRSRSAEQTARVLLSNAVRYDTWECRASKENAGVGPLLTVQLAWDKLPAEFPFSDAVALHMTLYNNVLSTFVGATHVLPRSQVTAPVVFQSPAVNILLVVEVVGRDERPEAPVEGQRVLLWGYVPLAELTNTSRIVLHPGNAQMLRLNTKSLSILSGETHSLGYTSSILENPVALQLMSQLVPPGIIVPQTFIENTPDTSSSSFRCVLRNIQLHPTEGGAKWTDTTAEWRVAAVAHNGYQQLGKGAEVSLTFDEGDGLLNSSPISSETSRQRLLHSVTPLEMDGLVVHSTTSLVLAIRRRSMGEQHFEVLGFCVFPLCVMPMKDCDVRVENLPALRGPFSCRDSRMVKLESASPYGKIPILVTLTLEYYDTGNVGDSSLQPPIKLSKGGKNAVMENVSTESKLGGHKSAHLPSEMDEITKLNSSPFARSLKPPRILSTEDEVAPGELTTSTSEAAVLEVETGTKLHVERTQSSDVVVKQGREDQSSLDIFKMLCNIMEELRHLREMQRETMGSGHPRGATRVQRTDEGGKRLSDAVDIHAVDLLPNHVSISWDVRCQMEEDMQPILHPFHGTRLEDHSPATVSKTASLFGVRFEGLSVDDCITVPEDICFIFSFGSLPFQTIGPIHTVCINKAHHLHTFKLYEGGNRGGTVWCEPLEAERDPFVHQYKQRGDASVYIHVYNALTMFYVGSANVQLSNFRRPYNADSAQIPMDLVFYRDLSLTWTNLPAKVLPVVRNAGQMHVTLFCVAMESPLPLLQEKKVVEPPRCSRVIIAKKLPHATLMEQPKMLDETKTADAGAGSSFAAASTISSEGQLISTQNPAAAAVSSSELGTRAAEVAVASTAVASGAGGGGSDLHWRRAQYVKQLYGGGMTVPGVPREHLNQNADAEFRLRYLEKQRDEIKSRKIAEALMERLTVHHHLCVTVYRPERVCTIFQNPFSRSMKFTVEVDAAFATPAVSGISALEVVSSPSFHLGPHERTEVLLVVRLNAWKNRCGGNKKDVSMSEPVHLRAYIYTEGREVVRILDVHATVGPPLVDRRYEIFGPHGAEVSKRIFSRFFSSQEFPITSDVTKILARMRDMCARISITSELTTAEANAVLDPVTQTFVTAWEEVKVHTIIPHETATQRVEYLTLFGDDAMSKALEVWELCIFPCHSINSRELLFGQTTTLTIPSAGMTMLYCSDSRVKVECREGTYTLHLRPQEVGTQQLLLHALMDHHLAKTLLTVSTVYPTPTYTQTLEFSLMDTTAPIFRRLHFVHHGSLDDVFTVHHNYKYQLHVTPKQFALAPNESQFVTLQIDMLTLPEGQLEGRWPMWIFFNNSNDKTVESYLLHVVLRAHRVVHNM